MSTLDEQTLFRYLDAKFDGMHERLDHMDAAWHEDSKLCHTERTALLARVGRLENWRAYVTGAVAVIAVFATGLIGWVWEAVRAVAAAK